MADKEISELTEKTSPVGTDEIELQETGGGDSRKATLANAINSVWGASGSYTIASGDLTLTSGAVNMTSGDVVFTAGGTGVDFSATSDGSGTTTSEILDDYEEGTFTPVFTWSSGSDTTTYSQQIGTYTKTGDRVQFCALLQSNSSGVNSSGASSSEISVSGLPFTSANDSLDSAVPVYIATGMSVTASENPIGLTQANATTVKLYLYDLTTGAGPLTEGDFAAAVTTVGVSGIYRAA